MNTLRFVSGSSLILAGWLGATFLNEVPAQRYPRLDKKPAVAESSNPARPIGVTATKTGVQSTERL